jgi:hypothetical protein
MHNFLAAFKAAGVESFHMYTTSSSSGSNFQSVPGGGRGYLSSLGGAKAMMEWHSFLWCDAIIGESLTSLLEGAESAFENIKNCSKDSALAGHEEWNS